MVKSGSFRLAFCLDQNSILFSYNSMYYTYTGQDQFLGPLYTMYTHRVSILEGHSAVHSRLFGWSFTWLSF